jgi:hypothetical protein
MSEEWRRQSADPSYHKQMKKAKQMELRNPVPYWNSCGDQAGQNRLCSESAAKCENRRSGKSEVRKNQY